MGRLRDDEVRRLLAYLRQSGLDVERLAEIEDLLRSDEADDDLREEALLEFFPPLYEELLIRDGRWLLRIISHAHLRIVQRGISRATVSDMFRQFIEYSYAENQIIGVGHKIIIDSHSRRGPAITLRVDVDEVKDDGGEAHVVTVIIGRTSSDEGVDTVVL